MYSSPVEKCNRFKFYIKSLKKNTVLNAALEVYYYCSLQLYPAACEHTITPLFFLFTFKN